MVVERRSKRIVALIIVVALAAFVLYALSDYINAFFGAFILFVLFKPLYLKLLKLKLNKGLSAGIIILFSLLIVLVPSITLIKLTSNELISLVQTKPDLHLEFITQQFPEFETLVEEQLSNLANYAKNLLLSTVQSASNMIIGLVIMYFLLYYLFVNHEELPKLAKHFIPFNKKNTQTIIDEFKGVTYSTVVTSGVIAVMQGVLLGCAFVIFGIPSAILWGFVGAVLSFLPVLGTPIIWVPVVIIQAVQSHYGVAIGILVSGIVISNLDNFVRPLLQEKIARIHPLVSLIGIFLGLAHFGLMGIFIGPLLLVYFISVLRMFKEEYLDELEI